MKKLIYVCDRCGIEKEPDDSFWSEEMPNGWRHIRGEHLCEECMKKLDKMFDQFIDGGKESGQCPFWHGGVCTKNCIITCDTNSIRI